MKSWLHSEQIAGEIRAFANLMWQENAKSYLEIGSKFGGSLWDILSDAPYPMRAVSVDLHKHGDAVKKCAQELITLGHDVTLIEGDSRNQNTIELARKLGPYDVVYIDGDHSQIGVTCDWQNYGPMGRIVAFHDVSWKRSWMNPSNGMYVPYIWTKLKKSYRNKEFRNSPRDFGIGVLWNDDQQRAA
jgi:predicted O-methyltransferase YrrM